MPGTKRTVTDPAKHGEGKILTYSAPGGGKLLLSSRNAIKSGFWKLRVRINICKNSSRSASTERSRRSWPTGWRTYDARRKQDNCNENMRGDKDRWQSM